MNTKDIVIIVLVIAIILAVGGIFALNSSSSNEILQMTLKRIPLRKSLKTLAWTKIIPTAMM